MKNEINKIIKNQSNKQRNQTQLIYKINRDSHELKTLVELRLTIYDKFKKAESESKETLKQLARQKP
jgi:hypothetical protein